MYQKMQQLLFLDHSYTGAMGLNHTEDMDVRPRLSSQAEALRRNNNSSKQSSRMWVGQGSSGAIEARGKKLRSYSCSVWFFSHQLTNSTSYWKQWTIVKFIIQRQLYHDMKLQK